MKDYQLNVIESNNTIDYYLKELVKLQNEFNDLKLKIALFHR